MGFGLGLFLVATGLVVLVLTAVSLRRARAVQTEIRSDRGGRHLVTHRRSES